VLDWVAGLLICKPFREVVESFALVLAAPSSLCLRPIEQVSQAQDEPQPAVDVAHQ